MPAEPLDDVELEPKERYIRQGFPDWSRRDFQQLVRGLETHGWCDFIHLLTDLLFNPFAGMRHRKNSRKRSKTKVKTMLLLT